MNLIKLLPRCIRRRLIEAVWDYAMKSANAIYECKRGDLAPSFTRLDVAYDLPATMRYMIRSAYFYDITQMNAFCAARVRKDIIPSGPNEVWRKMCETADRMSATKNKNP